MNTNFKKSIFFGVALLTISLFSSCSTRIVSSKAVDMDPEVRPIMADLEVKYEKVTGTFTSNDKRVFKWGKAGDDAVVRNAIFQALNSVKADVLVGLQYQVTEVRNSMGRIKEKTVVVTGYPAYYKNIRPTPIKNNEFITKELKPETPYIITEKDGDGNSKVYTIITPSITETPVLNLEDAEFEHVILSKDKEKGKKAENHSFIDKIKTSISKKSKK